MQTPLPKKVDNRINLLRKETKVSKYHYPETLEKTQKMKKMLALFKWINRSCMPKANGRRYLMNVTKN